MSTLIVIPARFGSSRFPGKPLAPVAGTPLLQRVWAIAKASAPDAQVVVATDDTRIETAAHGFGAEVVMTDPSIRNGTERVAATLAALGSAHDFVVNLQGDAALTPPWVVRALVEAGAEPGVEMVTPATIMGEAARDELIAAKAAGEVGGTTVVFDHKRDALYFSKAVIPFIRPGSGLVPLYRHIGLYGYRAATLAKLVALEPGPLEQVEQLEQLRALENGIPIRVTLVDYRGRTHWSIDSASDLTRCEALIAAEGELLPRYDGTAGMSAA